MNTNPIQHRLRPSILLLCLYALCASLSDLRGQVPQLINFQGRVAVGTTNFQGTGQFKFLLVNAAGTTAYWTNDGTNLGPITAATQPTALVSLPVTKGLYSVLLGDTSPPLSLAAIPTTVWANADVRLRVWFNDGTANGWQLLTPDQRVAPASYLSDGSVTSAKLADTAVTSAKLAGGAVGPGQLAPNAVSSANLLTLGVPASGQVLSFNGTGLNWITPTTGGGGTLTLPFSQNGSSASPLFSISNSSSGSGLTGSSTTGRGVYGSTATGNSTVAGVWGENSAVGGTAVVGNTLAINSAGVSGIGDTGNSTGVYGRGTRAGVIGNSTSGDGVYGSSGKNGVHGLSTSGTDSGIWGENNSAGSAGHGVAGSSSSGSGVYGISTSGIGVYGSSVSGLAGYFAGNVEVSGKITIGSPDPSQTAWLEVVGHQDAMSLVGHQPFLTLFDSNNNSYAKVRIQDVGGNLVLHPHSGANGNAAHDVVLQSGTGNLGIGTDNPIGKLDVVGPQDAVRIVGYEPFLTLFDSGAGYARSRIQGANGDVFFETHDYTLSGNPLNGLIVLKNATSFVGIGTGSPQAMLDVAGTARVKVLTITGGADVAEPFQMSTEEIAKGSVVVIDEEHPGQLRPSAQAYDARVAGIVSGANGINPGIALHQEGVLEGGQNVALSGRVYVLADASGSPIRPGDMLTTSDTPGHAMKATDRNRAQGAIIGKAMSALNEGTGMVLVLVTLQ